MATTRNRVSDTAGVRHPYRLLVLLPMLAAVVVHLTYSATHAQNPKFGEFPSWDVGLLAGAFAFAFVCSLAFARADRTEG